MQWLQNAPAEIRAKLAKVGLIVVEEAKTCQMLWDTFMKHKVGAKTNTILNYQNTQTRFLEMFLPTETIDKITPIRLAEWTAKLRTEFAEATVATHSKNITAVLNWAVNRDWLTKNPMAKIPKGSFKNRKKRRRITMEEYSKLLDACPNQEWRTIIALSRIGGLRCPSELQQLRWTDVDWNNNRFLVKSPKTEHHEDHSERTVPLFPELRLELEKHLSGNEFVIASYQGTDWQLYYPFQDIAEKAGLGTILCPFRNMRRSRSNEVMRKYGSQMESLWIGHSEKVMEDHYFELEDEDFLKASGQISHAESHAERSKNRTFVTNFH